MATIINSLEVIVDQPSAGGAAPGAPPRPQTPAPPAPPLRPRDLEDVLERQALTAARLAAH
jgi:hypothetical protein